MLRHNVLLAIAVATLAFAMLFEIISAMRVAWWIYAPLALAFVAALARRAPIRGQIGRLLVLGAGVAAIAALYLVDWSSRKPFLRDLGRIEVGMTVAEVRAIMAGYLEGTGWRLPVGDAPDHGSPREELVLPGAMVFRHSEAAAFNSDWGLVHLAGGRVVKVEFSAD